MMNDDTQFANGDYVDPNMIIHIYSDYVLPKSFADQIRSEAKSDGKNITVTVHIDMSKMAKDIESEIIKHLQETISKQIRGRT